MNTSDGRGVNAGTGNPGGAVCCDGLRCSPTFFKPNCVSPIGYEYNDSIASCAAGNNITSSVEMITPGLECCKVKPTLNSGLGFKVYWSRRTSSFAELTDAAIGDSVYCNAINAGSPATFDVKKPSTSENGNPLVIGGIASFAVLADETGTYTCNVSGTTATLKVSETGKSATALPFFGFFQFVSALMIIIIYQIFKKR